MWHVQCARAERDTLDCGGSGSPRAPIRRRCPRVVHGPAQVTRGRTDAPRVMRRHLRSPRSLARTFQMPAAGHRGRQTGQVVDCWFSHLRFTERWGCATTCNPCTHAAMRSIRPCTVHFHARAARGTPHKARGAKDGPAVNTRTRTGPRDMHSRRVPPPSCAPPGPTGPHRALWASSRPPTNGAGPGSAACSGRGAPQSARRGGARCGVAL